MQTNFLLSMTNPYCLQVRFSLRKNTQRKTAVKHAVHVWKQLWWDLNPQPLNAFAASLEDQRAIHCTTEPPEVVVQTWFLVAETAHCIRMPTDDTTAHAQL